MGILWPSLCVFVYKCVSCAGMAAGGVRGVPHCLVQCANYNSDINLCADGIGRNRREMICSPCE